MKRLLILAIVCLLFIGCKKRGCVDPNATNYSSLAEKDNSSCIYYTIGNGVTDIDNNTYATVIIGEQEWMSENLRTTRYSNGDEMHFVEEYSQLTNLDTGAYFWPYFNNNYENYGRFYNNYVVADSRNVCPIGWHVPTLSEWNILVDYIGGEDIAGEKMKSNKYWDEVHWTSTGLNGTNSSGLNVLPIYLEGIDYNIFISQLWSSSTSYIPEHSWQIKLTNNSHKVDFSIRDSYGSGNGTAIRCLKD